MLPESLDDNTDLVALVNANNDAIDEHSEALSFALWLDTAELPDV